jgi:hypothetical protein
MQIIQEEETFKKNFFYIFLNSSQKSHFSKTITAIQKNRLPPKRGQEVKTNRGNKKLCRLENKGNFPENSIKRWKAEKEKLQDQSKRSNI